MLKLRGFIVKGLVQRSKNFIAFATVAVLVVNGLNAFHSSAAGRVDTTEAVTITAVIDPYSDSSKLAQKYQGDLEFELYKIADLDTAGSPTVSSEFKNAGIDLSYINSSSKAEDVKQYVTEPATEFVKANHDSLTKRVITGIKSEGRFEASTTIANGAGIYLYYVSKETMDAVNIYNFTPTVFYAPTSDYVLTGQGSDTWNYSVNIYPKAEAEPRFGNLEIKKTLNTFNKSLGTAGFVFDVEVYQPEESSVESETKTLGELVYSNVYTMNFDSATTQSVTIEHLPAGAIAYVTEVYSGASYTKVAVPVENVEQAADAGSGNGITIVADDTVAVEFVNDYDDRVEVGGVSVENRFSQSKVTDEAGNATFDYKWEGSNLPKTEDTQNQE